MNKEETTGNKGRKFGKQTCRQRALWIVLWVRWEATETFQQKDLIGHITQLLCLERMEKGLVRGYCTHAGESMGLG